MFNGYFDDLRRRCFLVLFLPQPSDEYHQARGCHASLETGALLFGEKNGVGFQELSKFDGFLRKSEKSNLI